MDEEKLLAARATNLDAAATTNEKQPACARPEFTLSQLTHRAIRTLNREREERLARSLIWGVFTDAFQAECRGDSTWI